MLLHWIWLSELKISLLQKHRLLEKFGSPEELYLTDGAALQNLGISQSIREALQEKDLRPAERILRTCTDKKVGLLPLTDLAYPTKLRNTTDAPLLLYYKGILPDWESRPFIGIVGTRKATAYGQQTARQMGRQIAASGGIVVSGCAAGGDAAAMWGALEAGCPVVGILGCGVDVVYPVENRKLFQVILDEGGCLFSEYPPGAEPLPWHFPERNRIISGLSSGVLVVEAPKRSGALITARHALEQGRDVFVVPGNINIASCEGSNLLLQEGATAVLSGWDVLCTYEYLYPGKLTPNLKTPYFTGERSYANVAQNPVTPVSDAENRERTRKKPVDKPPISSYSVLENKEIVLTEAEQAVLAQLTPEPQEPAELIAKLSLPAGKVLSALTMLTVKGIVRKHPGGRVSIL